MPRPNESITSQLHSHNQILPCVCPTRDSKTEAQLEQISMMMCCEDNQVQAGQRQVMYKIPDSFSPHSVMLGALNIALLKS